MKSISGSLGSFRYKIAVLDGGALSSGADRAANAAVSALAEKIKAESTAIAPLRTGALIASARMETKGVHSAVISYNKIYARYQHEGVNFKHPNGRKAKYLESIMQDPATAQAARDLFAREIQKNLKG